MKLRVIVLLVLTLLGCAAKQPVPADAETLSSAFKRVHSSVVVIQTEHQEVVTGPNTQPVNLRGLGSGVLISRDGKVMTAAHVVQTADDIRVHFKSGEIVSATVVSSDPAADVALLKVERVPARSVVAKLGDSDRAEVGDQVFVVGAPAGMSYTMTVGHISAKRMANAVYGDMLRGEFLQTDAAINPGNSGGPMFNRAGEVIGIASYIISKSGGFEGLGFVVTSNMARRLLLERNSFWGGVEGFLLTGHLAQVFNVPQKAGLLIQRVAKRSPAARLGLRPGTLPAVIDGQPLIVGGDIILEVQGVPIVEQGTSHTVIRERLARLRPGSTIMVTVWRNGEKRRLRGILPAVDR